MHSYLGALSLMLLCFTPSFAYLDGAGIESCYDHSIIHETTLAGQTVISRSETCTDPCGYTLTVVGEVMENGVLKTLNETETTGLVFKPSTTYQLLLRQGNNGFLGFLIQARNSNSTTFNASSEIVGTWESNRPLYKTLMCNSSSMSTEGPLFPNSATQETSNDFRGADAPGEVTLYWISPEANDGDMTITFWYTVVQQLLTHFLPVRGPVGTLPSTPTSAPTTMPTTPQSSTTMSTGTSSSTTSTITDTKETGLSMSEIIGIGVGGGLGVILVIVVLVLLIAIIVVKKSSPSAKKSTKPSRASVLWTTDPTKEVQVLEAQEEILAKDEVRYDATNEVVKA